MEDIYRNKKCSWINKMLNVIIIGWILKCLILLGVVENAENTHMNFLSVFPSGYWKYSSSRLFRVPGKVSRWCGGGRKSRVHWGVFQDHQFYWMTSNKYHLQKLPILPRVKLKTHTTKSISRWWQIDFNCSLGICCRCMFCVCILCQDVAVFYLECKNDHPGNATSSPSMPGMLILPLSGRNVTHQLNWINTWWWPVLMTFAVEPLTRLAQAGIWRGGKAAWGRFFSVNLAG